MLSAKEWLLPEKVRLPSNGSVLYTEKSALQASFNGEGELKQSLPLLAMGNVDELARVFQDYGLSLSYVSSPTKLQPLLLKKSPQTITVIKGPYLSRLRIALANTSG